MPLIKRPDRSAVMDAAARLNRGELVAVPTETVYGLAADLRNVAAIRRVFELKGRPADNPLIAHVLDVAMARGLAADWPDMADGLARSFWPGPLTLVLPCAEDVPDEATAGRDTIAVRAPSHSVCRDVLRATGFAVVAPSANRSGGVSPTTAKHVADDFRDASEMLILDGGACDIGIESTVLDLTTTPPRVLRPGAVSVEKLRGVIGPVVVARMTKQAASPGTAAQHYAPVTRAVMCDADEIDARLVGVASCVVLAMTWGGEASGLERQIIRMPTSGSAYGQRLYAALREADDRGGSMIVIERPPVNDEVWEAIHDRLHRATA